MVKLEYAQYEAFQEVPFSLLYPLLNLNFTASVCMRNGRGVTEIGFGPQFSGRCSGT